jgi:hypothetical protein
MPRNGGVSFIRTWSPSPLLEAIDRLVPWESFRAESGLPEMLIRSDHYGARVESVDESAARFAAKMPIIAYLRVSSEDRRCIGLEAQREALVRFAAAASRSSASS